jgi:hypothetical protein
MNPQEQIPSLHAITVQMLPGMRRARALLDVSVHVLEYFEQHAITRRRRGGLRRLSWQIGSW